MVVIPEDQGDGQLVCSGRSGGTAIICWPPVPINARPADAERFLAISEALRLHLAHSVGLYRGGRPLWMPPAFPWRLPSSWRSLKGWGTFVFSECDSACAAIWLNRDPLFRRILKEKGRVLIAAE